MYVGLVLHTSASLLSISGTAFSTAVFWMKAQASSVLSALNYVQNTTQHNIITLYYYV